jgi:hypothetical protein
MKTEGMSKIGNQKVYIIDENVIYLPDYIVRTCVPHNDDCCATFIKISFWCVIVRKDIIFKRNWGKSKYFCWHKQVNVEKIVIFVRAVEINQKQKTIQFEFMFLYICDMCHFYIFRCSININWYIFRCSTNIRKNMYHNSNYNVLVIADTISSLVIASPS